jgi:hypothetical protein
MIDRTKKFLLLLLDQRQYHLSEIVSFKKTMLTVRQAGRRMKKKPQAGVLLLFSEGGDVTFSLSHTAKMEDES